MSKIYNPVKLTLGELMTIKTYLGWLKEKKGIETTKQAIHYQLEKTDNLDFCEWQGNKLILFNKKANLYTPKESKRG